MQRHGAAMALVSHLHLEPEEIAELPFEHFQIGIDRFGCVACARPPDVRAWPGPRLLAPSATLGLAYGQAFHDDLARQFLGVGRGGYRPRMTHADIAFQ